MQTRFRSSSAEAADGDDEIQGARQQGSAAEWLILVIRFDVNPNLRLSPLCLFVVCFRLLIPSHSFEEFKSSIERLGESTLQ